MSFDPRISDSPELRFELLSAYVDHEVTATERLQVEKWLAQDPKYRQQHQHLLQIKRLLIDLPIPASQKHDCLVDAVMAKIEQRSQRRWAWGSAIAAIMIAAIGSVFAIDANTRWQTANQPESPEEQLILAMEKPIIPIPQSLTDR